MRSRLTPLAVISIAAAMAASVAYGKTPQEIFEHSKWSVVDLRTGDEFGDVIGTASGVVISSDLVATACHVVSGSSEIIVRQSDPAVDIRDDYKIVDAEIVASNPDTDTCILRVPKLPSEPAGWPVEIGSTSNLAVGDEVYALSSPLSLGLTITRGIVSRLMRLPGDPPYIITDAATSIGSWGGALIDSNGKLVGMTVSSVKENADGITFAHPIEWVIDLATDQLPSVQLGRN